MESDLEGQDTHVLVDVQLARPVEVQDGVEGSGVAVKEVFVLDEAVVRRQTHDLLVGGHPGQMAQPGDIFRTKCVITEGLVCSFFLLCFTLCHIPL